jgi:ubiquinone/menaquinone biosynthesis C-methylase UbiE
MHDYISGSFLRQSTTVEQALAAKHALEAPKQLGLAEEPKQILVAGVGMSGIRMIDSWKEREGQLHLVDTDPFVASVLRHYARINGSKNVVVHDEDLIHLDLPGESFDHIRFSYCLKYMKTAGTDRLALLSAHSLLKEGGQLTIHEMTGNIDKKLAEHLAGMGMRVDVEQTATNPMRLVALKQAKGEKGRVMPWRNKGIRVIPKEPV